MATTTTEQFGRSVDQQSLERTYTVEGTTDEVAARNAIITEADTTVTDATQGLTYVLDDVQTNEIADNLWLGQAMYKLKDDKDPEAGDDPRWSFSTGGGTEHITASISTQNSYKAGGGDAADMKQLIGVQADGSVAGVDVPTRHLAWQETHYFTDAQVTDSYIDTLFDLTGTANNATFKFRKGGSSTFAAHEVLLKNVEGGQMANGDWELTFHFEARPNVTGKSVGDITGIDKDGWEYLWIYHVEDEDGTAVAPVQVPQYAYVEQVVTEGDFSQLGIR